MAPYILATIHINTVSIWCISWVDDWKVMQVDACQVTQMNGPTGRVVNINVVNLQTSTRPEHTVNYESQAQLLCLVSSGRLKAL